MAPGNKSIDVMLAPYRESAANAEPKRGPRLIRFTGCRCTPPRDFWCWWHRVRSGDLWECEHGAQWESINGTVWRQIRAPKNA